MHEDRSDARQEQRLSFYYQQQLIEAAKMGFVQFAALLKNAFIYPPAHPFLLGSAEQLLNTLEGLFSKRKEASYYFVSGELFFETLSIPLEEALSLTVEDIAGRDIGGIVFQPGLARDELVAFAYILKKDRLGLEREGGITSIMNKASIRHITVHRLMPLEKRKKALEGSKASEIYMEAIEVVKDIVASAHVGRSISSSRLHGIVHAMVDSIMENRDALIGLTSIKLYDEYTFAHSVNVAILCAAVGAYLSFDRPRAAALSIAGMLHDIGKVRIPIEIINKPGALTEAEWEIVQRHPAEGAVILSGLPGVGRLAAVAAFEHHKHHDLTGYPRYGAELFGMHPFSKIVEIADAYDALTSARVYYHAVHEPYDAMRTIIAKRGTAFDPVLVKVFVNVIGIFPIGTLLRLDTGEIGLVVNQTADLMRPRVLLLRSFDVKETEEVSLLEREGGRYKRTPVATVDPNALKIDIKPYLS